MAAAKGAAKGLILSKGAPVKYKPQPEKMSGNICVFASARSLSPELDIEAYELGQTIAEHNMGLVYGGFGGGLMGAVAAGVRSRKGRVIGVIPGRGIDSIFNNPIGEDEGEDPYALNSQTIGAGTLENRKRIMLNRSDAVIALPGGIGTFDELATTFMENRSGMGTRGAASRVALVNTDGFYEGIRFTLDMMGYTGAVGTDSSGYAHLAETALGAFDHVYAQIERAKQPISPVAPPNGTAATTPAAQ